MKTIEEITNIIANSIAKSVDIEEAENCHVVVCTERVFIDDYVTPQIDDLARHNRDISENIESPLDVPYQHTIFIVLKFGQGQINKAVLHMPVSIQCLSEQNDFSIASKILRNFSNLYNFEYTEGVVMSFYTPEMMSAAETVYDGYRGLLACRGTVKVPEDGLVFCTEVWCFDDSDDYSGWFKIPFISMQDNWSAQTDPQSFSGNSGRTMNLNRQSTTTESFNGYLWNYTDSQIEETEDDDTKKYMHRMNNFSKKIMSVGDSMNTKFRLYFKSNVISNDLTSDSFLMVKSGPRGKEGDSCLVIEDSNSVAVGYYLPISCGWYTLASRSYGQAWGDINAWSMSFTESKQEED